MTGDLQALDWVLSGLILDIAGAFALAQGLIFKSVPNMRWETLTFFRTQPIPN
jgi:hypothetical protein